MTVRTPLVAWDEETRTLHVVLHEATDASPPRSVRRSLLCWVNFDAAGAVCGVDVHDVSPDVTRAIPHFTGVDIIGRTLLDDGWLWIPLSDNSTHRRRSGSADVRFTLDTTGLAALTVHFSERKAT
ncbi:hypothetical protein HCA58_05960 [Micromonospora sp. HNM0581]|uniref:hypothetical protein n=1 Tax=Micromonospora sp. HNM0581 TaxID=2716341 RepID=UPI00146C5993|nr:hypothetical protein [Micromonospora sp. HNM0581]NLU77946.1 hypothetical protein [Micromonospora sp. HNM0581]